MNQAGLLEGVRVADFSRVLAGPYATMTLADFGADVIKIESPGGDETRHWAPPTDARGQATYFASVNRSKRSTVCDLRTEEGLAHARALAVSADIVVENFRPGVMERFGLDAETLRAENPRLIYCSITGFGADAGARLPGFDLLVQAVGGLMSITGEPNGEPSKVGVALVDVLTAQNAVQGILLALRRRDQTGDGSVVEVNLLSSLLAALSHQAGSTLAKGEPPKRYGNAHPSIAPYELFHARDRPLVIAVGNDRQFAQLCDVLNMADLAYSEHFATNSNRVLHREALSTQINARLADDDAQSWVERLMSAGVPAGLVNSIDEAIELAESLGLAPVVEASDDGVISRSMATPIWLDDVAAQPASAPPRLGAHPHAQWRQ